MGKKNNKFSKVNAMATIRVIDIAVKKYLDQGRNAEDTVYYINQQLEKYYDYIKYLNSQESDNE